MELKDLQLNRQLYRTQPQTVETLGADAVASNLSAPPSTAIASGNSVTDVNTNAETINGSQITPGTIPASSLNIANWGWTQTCAFSVSDADTIAWGSGTFRSADGSSIYSISGGNTGNMAALTYVYLDIAISTTAYQTTTNVDTPIGVGKVLIAVCQNGSPTATYNLVQAHQIVGDNVIANSLNANRIVAGSITATQISASYVYAGTISADNITAGTMTGSTVRTSAGADRVQMVAGNNSLELYESSTLRAALIDDGLILYNVSGVQVGSLTGANSTGVTLEATSTIGFEVGGLGYFVISDIEGLNVSRTIRPLADVTYDLGTTSDSWKDSWIDGTEYYRQVAQPLLYFGYISGTTLSQSNASWTITNPTTGNYTIAHNFGTTNYTIVATALRGAGAGAYSAKIQQRNSNDARVTIFDDTGGSVASDFMFLITKI